MSFTTQKAADVAFLFASEAAITGQLNGTDTTAIVLEQRLQDASGAKADDLDVAFLQADYSTVTYKTDTFVALGSTWRYPTLLEDNGTIKVVTFRKSERPSGYKR